MTNLAVVPRIFFPDCFRDVRGELRDRMRGVFGMSCSRAEC